MAIVKKYGIDVSYYQGAIDWNAVKATGCEWVILRAGFGNSDVDTQFVNNITGAVAAGFTDIGIYWFSYAKDAYTASVEVQKCLDTIAPYSQYITLPVFFDWEEASYSYVQRTYGLTLTASQIQTIARTWCNAITAAGYDTGIYSNKSNASGWFSVGNGQYLWDELGCEFWYARYGANNETSLFITPAFEQTALAEHPETVIYQYSDVGRVSGINSQRVDLNIRYEDEPTPTPPPTPPTPPAPIIEVDRNEIEYIEVRGADFGTDGIIDTFNSVIWHSKYYGVGDFEIYTQATPEALELLAVGNYITRPNDIEVGIIEKIVIADSIQDGKMITATGRFAKSILDRRHIYKVSGISNTATILRGNVETAIRQVVSDNAISCAADSRRNITELALGASSGITKIIVDGNGNAADKQVSYENLLDYTESVLEEYGLASVVIYDETANKLKYIVFEGDDRSSDNAAGNTPVVFSREFDNLTEDEYTKDTAEEKNTALIGGAGEGIDRFYTILEANKSGLARRETWVDASSINRTYKDENDQEQTYSNAEYRAMLEALGKQDLRDKVITETLNGTIDVTNGNYVYNRDFYLGDIVTVQDNDLGVYVNVRVTEVTEVQDADGYKIDVTYR